MQYRIIIIIVTLCIITFSCTKQDLPVNKEAGNNGSTNSGETPGNIIYNVDKVKVLQLINNVRQSGCNCSSTSMPPVPPVVWNDKLAKAGYDHSVEMKVNNYFSHTGLNGSNPGQRITATGYSWKTYGENIAKGYTSEQSVVNGWLSSEGHCKNIMNANFKEMGAGREENYWTQVFGTK